MDATTYELLAPDVKTAARTTARQWPDVIDRDDAEQEIWLRLLDAGQGVVDSTVALDKPARVSMLTEIGHQIAMKERDAHELFSGNFYYSTDEVRKLLENGALLDIEDHAYGTGGHFYNPDRVAGGETESLFDLTGSRSDVKTGMERLAKRNSRYHGEIINRYQVSFYDPPVLDQSARKVLQRAVDALSREMNHARTAARAVPHEGPGSREVVSNYDAIRHTGRVYADR